MSASGVVLEGPLLENTANNLSPEGRRALRWGRREVLWQASSLQRVRHCGRVVVDVDAGVTGRNVDGVGGLVGLQHCGSVWADPVCAGRILVHRALEIGEVLGEAVRQGYVLAFLTFTLRHHLGQRLSDVWDGARSSWQAAISGKYWQAAKATGVVGWVRVWEVTYGSNGWHPHAHVVMVLKPAAGRLLDQIAGGMYRRWDAAARKLGFDTVRAAQDWHLVHGPNSADEVGAYLAKLANTPDEGAGLGLELTHTLPGRSAAATATRPPWGILDHLVLTGEAEAHELWHEWEAGSKGKRQIGWSKGLRERFVNEVELTDDEIVAQELGTHQHDVLKLDTSTFRELVKVRGRSLELVDALGRGVGPQLLDSWGLRYTLVKGD